MVGRISIGQERRMSWGRELILDMPFLRVELPQRWAGRHLRRGARLLKKQGVRKVIAPEDFPQWAALTKYGLRPVEPGELCRAMAAPLTLALLEDPEAAVVVLRGERVTRAMRMAALALCPQVRRLLVAAPVGGEALQRELRREFGLPVVEDRWDRVPDLAVHFAPEMGPGRRVLDLSGPRPDLGELTLCSAAGTIPADADQLALLAALWEGGRVGEVTVRRRNCST